nr:hypothetical protein [Mycoplasmopsis bovis]
MVKRGAIEIRRIFNSDKFVLRYWRVSPTSIDGDEDLSFTLAINNKVVEQTSDNRQNVKYTNKELGEKFRTLWFSNGYKLLRNLELETVVQCFKLWP